MTSAQRIGIYGGTFDPIHIGHLAIAEEARYALGLGQVLFVPAARQPLKDDAQGATPEQRLVMARMACATNPHFAVSDLELRRPPPSYTVDTLSTLRAELDIATELVFILGADAARDLPRWHRAAEITRLVHLAIVGRPGYSLDLAALESRLSGVGERCTLIAGPRLDVSSSDLRARLALGRPARYQIPDPVLDYIAEHGLYRER
ncbi:nicotinate-nucleotide adenylyltransferase [Oscillochloris sp. ZM17-4]|uniref:nicotinate-nucleotide adenylyltransferase n=1 Tax=Oscillochloris sp. ZM17-4 TaxID=2866714 RepID=UPI001C72C657|nr:nicotinate-nucleotide adenylyltransferase [Oscillochloris sp. ZM17-4]